jgi:hypothetical protein
MSNGGRLVMGYQHRLDLRVGGDGLAYVLGIGSLAPLVREHCHLRPERFGDRREAVAEGADAHYQHLVARGEGIDDRRLHAAGAGCAEDQHILLGNEELLQPFRHPLDQGGERAAAVIDHRPADGLQDVCRDGRRPRYPKIGCVSHPTSRHRVGLILGVALVEGQGETRGYGKIASHFHYGHR